MMENTNSIICDQNARVVLKNIKGYQEDGAFDIYYCPSCNTSFVWPHVLDNSIYNPIYSQPDIVPGYNRYALYAKEIISKKNTMDYLVAKEAMYYAIKNIPARQKDKTIEILEVGLVLGYLTYAIRNEGYDITGLDISVDAIKKAEKQFGKFFICRDICEHALENAEKFDLVTLTEVIEPLQDPIVFTSVVISLLKSGGKLIISSPNKSAFKPDDYWDTESPAVHLTWFSEDSFIAISEKLGLLLSFFDFSQFNKKHIDIARFKYYEGFYKRKHIGYTLNSEGKVITPEILTVNVWPRKLKAAVKKLFKPIIEKFFIIFLTHPENPGRNSIMCAILQKQV
ncbi:MAG: class I SAM-dependent methyltransferase [Ferruginibacter sp.]